MVTTSKGISGAALANKIPEKWSAAWFQSFITTYLQNADIRNATAGPGVAITGNIATPATLSAAQLVLAGESVFGNPTGASAPGTSIKATGNNQVLQSSAGELLFSQLLFASGTDVSGHGGLGPAFTVTGLTAGTLLQAAGPSSLFFTNFTTPTDVVAGDLWYGSAAETLSALGVGSNGQVLAVVSNLPAWAAASSVAVTSVLGTANQIDAVTVSGVATISIDTAYVGQTSITTLGTITTGTWQGTTISTSFLPASQTQLTAAANLVTVGTITSGVWTGTSIAIANGGTGQTTAANAFKALNPTTTTGDIIYANAASGGTTRLAIGATGTVLTVSGGIPAWAASPQYTGIGASYGVYGTSIALSTGAASVGAIAVAVAGTYLVEWYAETTTSSGGTLTMTNTVSSGTSTPAAGGELIVRNSSNTTDQYFANVMTASESIFTSAQESFSGWGITVLSAAATFTLKAALNSGSCTLAYSAIHMTRVA
jgi:hypothetical protein